MIELTLPTMTCGHCERTVKEAVRQVDPQAQVDVDLATHRVRIDSDHARAVFVQALSDEGYAPAV
jgi:copper chaperone